MGMLIWLIGWGIVIGMIWQGKEETDKTGVMIFMSILCLAIWPIILGAEIERGIDRG